MDDRGRVKAEEIGKRIEDREETGLARRRKGAKKEEANTEKSILERGKGNFQKSEDGEGQRAEDG